MKWIFGNNYQTYRFISLQCGTTPFSLPVWQNSRTGRIPPLSLSVGEATPGIFCSHSYPLSVCYVIVLLRMPYRILYQIHRRFQSQVDADKKWFGEEQRLAVDLTFLSVLLISISIIGK